jgi:hypothetical protein
VRKLIATIAAAVALSGVVGLTTASVTASHMSPYIEGRQDEFIPSTLET